VCAECRLHLDNLSGGEEWLNEVRKHLSSSELRAYHSENADTSGRFQNPRLFTKPDTTDEQDAGDQLDFLEPSNDPTKLGRLGAYEIDGVIGRGGMGVVLKAFDRALNRPIAIKVLAAQLATSGSARKRFSREAQAAAAVVHEHVVAIYAVDNSSKLPFIVMPFVPGRSLQDRLDTTGPLETREILRISIQTAAGLAAAHAQGLVHRDIKPANILLENGIERVLISDFGLARAVDDASQTQSGFIAGTPQYMAPEQARGEPVDHRADLFSLGSVMYTMCTGHPPFRAETTLAVLRRICEEQPRPPREANSEVPDWLEAVIFKLHAREPADRFQSAAEVAALLERYLAHLQHPQVHAMPEFHLTKTKPHFFQAFRWQRAAIWCAPSLLLVSLVWILINNVFEFKRLANPRPARSGTTVPLPASLGQSGGAGSSMGISGGPETRQRDPWPAWEHALNEVDQMLIRLESEVASPTTGSPRILEEDSPEKLRQQLDDWEQDLKHR